MRDYGPSPVSGWAVDYSPPVNDGDSGPHEPGFLFRRRQLPGMSARAVPSRSLTEPPQASAPFPAPTARPAASSVRPHRTAPYPALLPALNGGVSAPEVSDEVLAKAVRCDGDGEAMAELYRRYAGRVRGWAVNCRRHSAAEVDDLTAEVFTEALARLRAPEGDPVAYRIGSPFEIWLFGVVARYADQCSRRAWWRYAEAVRVAREDRALAPRDGVLRPAAGELGGELAGAVAALPEAERRVIELRYADGCTIETAAAVLGISESQAREASRRALRKLGRAERHRPAGARCPAPPRGMGSGGLRALAALAGALGEQPAVDADMACAALGIARRTANRMLTALAGQQLAVPLGSREQRWFRLETGKLTGTAPAHDAQ
jgi:RNA polymerase sigma-70 factor, ECF subfamily